MENLLLLNQSYLELCPGAKVNNTACCDQQPVAVFSVVVQTCGSIEEYAPSFSSLHELDIFKTGEGCFSIPLWLDMQTFEQIAFHTTLRLLFEISLWFAKGYKSLTWSFVLHMNFRITCLRYLIPLRN